ncbi:hypothetical protein R1sor_021155 [Riccia sorocarpa]|uniref:Peptide deformylase n=1 Tax=Riccia sorocarpa TaxID=122646 RepID=A0ABD3GLY9_9MARC
MNSARAKVHVPLWRYPSVSAMATAAVPGLNSNVNLRRTNSGAISSSSSSNMSLNLTLGNFISTYKQNGLGSELPKRGNGGKSCLAAGVRGRFIREQNGLGLGLNNRDNEGESLLLAQARRGFLTELQSLKEEAESPSGPVEFESPLGVILYPDPRLRAKNKRITVFDEKLQALVAEMFDVMYKTDGVGLSAPQVGVNVQMMLYNPEGERGKGQEYVLVNPKIVKYSKQRDVFREGCLSFPKLEADVERPLNVRVEAQDVKGKKFAISLRGWQARIFQHEYDHLEGILFHDRMTPEAANSILPGLRQLEDAYEKASGLPAPERVKGN